MKLGWHLVLKDARRFWPASVLWALLFTAHRFSDWRAAQATTTDVEILAQLKFFKILFFVVQLLSSYVFAATLVLEDSPVGTSTFWATRPIAGTRLLLAKVGSCVLWFIALAMLLSLPWWMAEKHEGRDWVLEAEALIRWQTWTVGTALVIAAFTGSLGKFLGWTLGLVCAFIALSVILSDRRGVTIEPQVWLVIPAAVALWMLYQRRQILVALGLLSVSTIAAFALAIRPAA